MSNIRDDRGISQRTFTTGSNSDVMRHREDKDQSSNMRYSERRSNLNEYTRYSSANNAHSTNNSNRRLCAKRDSTTFYTTSESPPIKRPRLPLVSYRTLTELSNKPPENILTEMLHPNFQLKKI